MGEATWKVYGRVTVTSRGNSHDEWVVFAHICYCDVRGGGGGGGDDLSYLFFLLLWLYVCVLGVG